MTWAKPACGATSICSTKSGPTRSRNAAITPLSQLRLLLRSLAVGVLRQVLQSMALEVLRLLVQSEAVGMLRQVLQSMALRVQLPSRQHCRRFCGALPEELARQRRRRRKL